MSRLLHSLYARIAAVYLLLLLGLAVLVMWITVAESQRFGRETQQRLHLELASNLATILGPAIRADPAGPAAREVAKHIAAINPAVDMYVLDAGGHVLAAYNHAGCAADARAALAPVHALLSHDVMLPLSAPLPCGGGQSIFSAAPLQLRDGATGYLYVALRGHPYHSAATMLKESYSARSMAILSITTLMIAGAGGLIWFGFLTRRFRALTASVDAFGAGDYAARVPSAGDDEIAGLARAFNHMATIIETQMAALRESDNLRRAQIANISHDFRTPLTSLRGCTERLMAQSGLLSGVTRMRYLRAILDNAVQLERLADQLSTMSRLDARNAPLRLEPFSAAELAQDIIVKFQPQAQTAGVRLGLESPPRLPLIVADIGLIERVMSNLIDNAVRNTPTGGYVNLSLTGTPGHVRVRITDTGRGIAAEELPLVTQRFYRVRDEREVHRRGSGLGLAIAHEALLLHGSKLRLESELGSGTTATFDLPIQQETSPVRA